MIAEVIAPDTARARITERLRHEITQPQRPEIETFARDLAGRYGDTVAAVVFYGSCLRNATFDGMLDFYVLVDDYRAASLSFVGAKAARLLPPAVYHHSAIVGGQSLQAKVAVILRHQFAQRMRPDCADSSIWARFCQPAALAYARDPDAAGQVVNALTDAVVTAGLWAARLGPESGTAEDYWQALFRATYSAELRVERAGRISQLYGGDAARYGELLSDAWQLLGFAGVNGRVENPLAADRRQHYRRVWHRRRWTGKLLNGARLVKAAFTFQGGADYVVWKIERHSGHRIQLTDFQRKHPILAAPTILWRLIQKGIIR